MDSEDAIKREFKARELSYIDAIQRLEGLGYSPEIAEHKVCQWEDAEGD
jgi:hypothetical protein